MTVGAFHALRQRRAIPGIKLSRVSWRFLWREVEDALLKTRVRAMPPRGEFLVERYNNSRRPNLRFRVYRHAEGKRLDVSYFKSESEAIADAAKRKRAEGTLPIAAFPDAWKRAGPDAPAWRVKPYFNQRQPNGAKYCAYTYFACKPVKRFFKTEGEALASANEWNLEVVLARQRSTSSPQLSTGEPAKTIELPATRRPEQNLAEFDIKRRLNARNMSLFRVYPYKCKSCPAVKWVVNGRINGTRHRRFFKEKDRAVGFAQDQNTELLNKGREAIEFPTWLRAMAQRSHETLAPYGATIDDAVKFYVEARRKRDASISIKDCVDRLINTKEQEDVTRRYLLNLRATLPRFAQAIGENLPMSEITTREINAYLGDLRSRRNPETIAGHATRLQARRFLSLLFEFAKVDGYCERNPVAGALKIKETESEVGIYRPEQLAELLRSCPSDFVPMIAIGAFAGLRSAELLRLDWRDVKLEQGCIVVSAKIAKSARRRIVHVRPCLDAWIRPLARVEGRVAPVDSFRPSKHLADAMAAAKLTKWVHNGLRHSFASYHLAKWENANALALEMGHTTTNLIFRHYRELVIKSDAERYWNILPLGQVSGSKIVNYCSS
jgi:integrase